MTRFKSLCFVLTSQLALACGGAGGGAGPETTAIKPATAAAASPVADDAGNHLARLRALDVIAVGDIIRSKPTHRASPYNHIPARELDLADFVAVAERAAAEPVAGDAVCEPEAVERNVAALRALAVVEVQGLVESKPEQNLNCYGYPCAEDVARAEADNCARARKLASIVAATKRSAE